MKIHRQHVGRAESCLRVVLLSTLLLATLMVTPSAAVDVTWTNAGGDFDYANGNNWSSNPFLPAAELDEEAIIDNGDAVFLDSALAGVAFSNPSKLNIATGSLEVRGNGSLEILQAGEDPDVFVQPNGLLVLRDNASLTADVNDPNFDFSEARLLGATRVVGPNVTFRASRFELDPQHVLVAEIDDPNTHSALTTPGEAKLDGTLALEFNGFTPSDGSAWTIINAGTVNQDFATIRAPTLPLGQSVVVSQTPGGNGTLVNATVRDTLVLSVNLTTGATSIDNLSSATTQDIDGYTITSSTNSLSTVGWTSLASGDPNWSEANAASNHLGELNLNGSRIIGTNSSTSLGAAVVAPTQFGDQPQLTFEYHLQGSPGETRTGVVDFENVNTLVLQVDPDDGQAQIINPSGFDVELDGYTIISSSGSLDPNGWTSLASGDPNWSEANPANNHLGELNLNGSEQLAKLESGSPLTLGNPLDPNSLNPQLDLTFEFHLAGAGATPGDFNSDGIVNGIDHLLWQRGQSPNPLSPSDLADWRANYGNTGGGGPGGTFTGIVQYVTLPGSASASFGQIPEPSSCVLVAFGALLLLKLRRRSSQ